MKTLFVTLVFSLQCLSSSLFAQSNGTIEIGLHGGAGGLWQRGIDAFTAYNPWWGDIAGFTVTRHLNPWFSLQGEANWERQYKKDEGTWTKETGEYGGTYISKFYAEKASVPILAHFSVGDKVQGFANAGPVFKYWLSWHSISTSNGITERYTNDNWTDFNRLQLEAAMGMGVIFPIRQHLVLSLEIRDHIGISSYQRHNMSSHDTRASVLYIMPGLSCTIR